MSFSLTCQSFSCFVSPRRSLQAKEPDVLPWSSSSRTDLMVKNSTSSLTCRSSNTFRLISLKLLWRWKKKNRSKMQEHLAPKINETKRYKSNTLAAKINKYYKNIQAGNKITNLWIYSLLFSLYLLFSILLIASLLHYVVFSLFSYWGLSSFDIRYFQANLLS